MKMSQHIFQVINRSCSFQMSSNKPPTSNSSFISKTKKLKTALSQIIIQNIL